MADSPRPRKKPAAKKKPAKRPAAKRKRKSNAGRKAHVYDERIASYVFGFALVGTAHEDICEVLEAVLKVKLSPTTLRKYYDLQLTLGRERAKARVARAIYNAAIQVEKDPRFGPIAIFYAKTQIGWREEDRLDIYIKNAIQDLEDAPISEEDKINIKAEMDTFLHDIETTGRRRR